MSTQCLLFIVSETNGSSTSNLRSSSKRSKSSFAAVSSVKGYALFPDVFEKKYPELLRLFEQRGFPMLSSQNVSSLIRHVGNKLEVMELLLCINPSSSDCLSCIVTDIINGEAVSLTFPNITILYRNSFRNENNMSSVVPAVEGKNLEVIEYLLRHDANIHVRHHLNESFLHLAAKRGPADLVGLLLEHGADVQARSSNGATPLHLAVLKRVGPVVQLLLQHGINIEARNDNGETPLHLAARRGLAQMAQLVPVNGAIVDCEAKHGDTALSIAAMKGGVDIVEVLLVHGANVNAKSKFNETPFSNAVTFKRIDTFKLLLKFAAKKDEYETRALKQAFEWGRYLMFQLLLERYFLDPELLKKSCIVQKFLDRLNQNRFWLNELNFRRCFQNLACHIVKIKALNLHPAADGIDASPLWTETVPTLRDFQTQCETEVACMKTQTLGDTDLILYDILAAGASKVACFLRNDSVFAIFTSNEVQKNYPIYASILMYHFQKGRELKSLLAGCMKIFQSLFCHFHKLPQEIREKILGYLSIKDLIVLKVVFGLNISP